MQELEVSLTLFTVSSMRLFPTGIKIPPRMANAAPMIVPVSKPQFRLHPIVLLHTIADHWSGSFCFFDLLQVFHSGGALSTFSREVKVQSSAQTVRWKVIEKHAMGGGEQLILKNIKHEEST